MIRSHTNTKAHTYHVISASPLTFISPSVHSKNDHVERIFNNRLTYGLKNMKTFYDHNIETITHKEHKRIRRDLCKHFQ